MDVIVRLSVPNRIYRFYKQASRYIAGYSSEDLMADALSAYTSMLSQEIAHEQSKHLPDHPDSPEK